MIRVNNIEIPEQAVASEMQYHAAESQRQAMIKAAEALIISELLRQRAGELGLQYEAEDSQDDGFSEQLFQQELEYPQASNGDCLSYYQANPEKFRSSPLYELRHILIAADAKDAEAALLAKDTAETVLQKLQQAPGSFAELAQAYSACTSKETGGQLGQISRGQTVPEFERQVFHCDQGLIPTALETRYGYHVVMVDHVVKGEQLPYEAVAERIRDYLNEKVRRKAIAQYIEQLIGSAEIEGFDFEVSDSPLMN